VFPDIFYPDDKECATIHDNVYPFVDEVHVIEWGFWEKWNKGKYPYQCDTEGGKRVFFSTNETNIA